MSFFRIFLLPLAYQYAVTIFCLKQQVSHVFLLGQPIAFVGLIDSVAVNCRKQGFLWIISINLCFFATDYIEANNLHKIACDCGLIAGSL